MLNTTWPTSRSLRLAWCGASRGEGETTGHRSPGSLCARSVLMQRRGQEAAVVFADLARHQPIQKLVVAQDELAVGNGVDGEIDHLIRIAFEVEQLQVVVAHQ